MSEQIDQDEHPLISANLEVEQLDVTLYRSRSLFIPENARGVFGGQVISQALVSATKTVDPAYTVHVSLLQPVASFLSLKHGAVVTCTSTRKPFKFSLSSVFSLFSFRSDLVLFPPQCFRGYSFDLLRRKSPPWTNVHHSFRQSLPVREVSFHHDLLISEARTSPALPSNSNAK